MRKLLIALLILILLAAAAGVTWIFKGEELSILVDRYGTTDSTSEQVRAVRYSGNGTGGVLYVNEISLSLNDPVPPLHVPSVGSTKDGKLGLAAGGKVFPFGQLSKASDDIVDSLAATPDPADDARISVGHSRLSWPVFLDLNFMTGSSPSWKRYSYQRLSWKKPNGLMLEMLWRYQQHFDQANGWTSPTMTREGVTGLIKMEIKE